MPVEKTADNPHGWGYTENRTVLEHYQLSPRIKIVVGDEIKVSKGPYWINKEGVKVSLDKMKGKWKVTAIHENSSGDIELRLVHMWPGGLFGSVSDITVTGNELSLDVGQISFVGSVAPTISGNALTSSLGDESQSSEYAFSGVSLAGTLGTLTVTGTSTLTLTGNSVTSSTGTLQGTFWSEVDDSNSDISWTEVHKAA